MTPTGIFPFSPIYVQAQKNDPVALEMLRLRLGFNSISDRLNGIELTRDEYQKLQMSFLKGKDESTGLTMWKKIGLLIRTEAYNSAAQTDENRKLTVQNIISAYKMRARYMLRTDQKLEVYLNGVRQTLTTHYSVTGAGTDSGGNVVFDTAPAASVAILILSSIPLTQTTNLVANVALAAETLEDNLDKLTRIAQQLKETDGRAIKFSKSSLMGLTWPAPPHLSSQRTEIFITSRERRPARAFRP